MSLKSFLFACDALRIEEGLSFHVETPESPLPTPADNKQRNAESMKMLQAMLGGVKKTPSGRARR